MGNKSLEQAIEDATRQIRHDHHKILDDFFKAYAAHICNLGKEFSLDDICLIEQEPHYKEGRITRRYWFEFRPKFGVSQWISIQDRKPEIDEWVLCYIPKSCTDPKIFSVQYCMHRWKPGDEWREMPIFRGTDRSWTADWATHWMPLPKPPEE